MASTISLLVVCAMGAAAMSAGAAGLTEAELTQIVKDVQLLPPHPLQNQPACEKPSAMAPR